MGNLRGGLSLAFTETSSTEQALFKCDKTFFIVVFSSYREFIKKIESFCCSTDFSDLYESESAFHQERFFDIVSLFHLTL